MSGRWRTAAYGGSPWAGTRQHRCYWWGVAGERALVHVQAWDGRMGAISTPDHLDALMDALEPRGVREHGLQASLEKVRLIKPLRSNGDSILTSGNLADGP